MLQPVINNICVKYNLPRNVVALGVFVIFLGTFIVTLVILMPIIYKQISILISKIPTYKHYIQTEIVPFLTSKVQSVDPKIADKIQHSLKGFINGAFSVIAGLFNNVWGYTMATINIFAIILLVPIILVYLLRDWPVITNNIDNLIPIRGRSKIREILSSINDLLSAYIRGQFNVCVILSVYYGIGLSIIGVDLGLLLGILSGFLIIVPFIGTLIAFSLSMIISYFSFGYTIKLFYVFILYIFGYLMENYLLTPKIIGDRIGLHPLWIMFAVFAIGSLFGFVGIFFAIPIAGIIKVLLKYGIEYYRSSSIYRE
jgi:putative permease